MSHHDLVIVGCGPVGAVAGNLAGRAGLSTLVLDRSTHVFDLPRAIHFDAQVMRILQQAGVADEVAPTTRVWARSSFYGADGELNRVHDWPTDRPQGWDEHYLFYQPTFEAVLRAGLARHGEVEVRLGVEVVGLEQHDDHVELELRETATGVPSRVTAEHVIGADGASSRIRSAIGSSLLDDGFEEPWLVVDLLADREIGEPNESQMFCDPRRPTTRVPGPGRHHRWEFMLLPGEDPERMQHLETVEALLRPWVGPDEVEIVRAAVYRFHALVADRWRDRRVFLAGDAAHQTPPFLGQGMCHGIRDVQNLVWKIDAVRRGTPPGPLLDSYQAERAPHVRQIIDMAVAAGRDICLLDPAAAADRDRRVRQAAADGALPRTTFQGMPPLSGGLFTKTPGAGELFPQPLVRVGATPSVRLDDLLPRGTVVIAAPGAPPLDPGVPVVEVAPEAAPVADPRIKSGAVLPGWFARNDAIYAVVRPDRYVLGTARTLEDIEALVRDVPGLGQDAVPRVVS